MLKETCYFLRHAPVIAKRRKEMGPLEFQKDFVRRKDAEGFKELRMRQLGGLKGDIFEIGPGTVATFPYYGPQATVTAMEPDDEFRNAAREAALQFCAKINVVAGLGETLPLKKMVLMS